jgi:hypothetical protein
MVVAIARNAAAFSSWLAHPDAATHESSGFPVTARWTGSHEIPFLQKEIPVLKEDQMSGCSHSNGGTDRAHERLDHASGFTAMP